MLRRGWPERAKKKPKRMCNNRTGGGFSVFFFFFKELPCYTFAEPAGRSMLRAAVVGGLDCPEQAEAREADNRLLAAGRWRATGRELVVGLLLCWLGMGFRCGDLFLKNELGGSREKT